MTNEPDQPTFDWRDYAAVAARLSEFIESERLDKNLPALSIALVDGDHGLLVLNPSRADIAAFRAERKRNRASRANDRLSHAPQGS